MIFFCGVLYESWSNQKTKHCERLKHKDFEDRPRTKTPMNGLGIVRQGSVGRKCMPFVRHYFAGLNSLG